MKLNVITLVVLIILYGCKNKQTESQNSSAFQVERDVFFNSLKTPDELADVVQQGSLKYNSTILHDPAIYPAYFSNRVKAAANMGIYIADLNYNLLLGERESNHTYFNAAHELSNSIGIEQGILQFLAARYSKNPDQRDSLRNIVQELLRQSTNNLRNTDREQLAGVAMAAYQIENLHLILSGLDAFQQSELEEEKKAYQQLIEFLFAYQTNIEVSYNFIHSFANPVDVTNNPNAPFFDNAFRELIMVYRSITAKTLTHEQLVELKTKVETIRNGVIAR